MPGRGQVKELSHKTALADAGRPRDQCQARALRVHSLVEEAGKRLDLLFAADHGDLHPFPSIERVRQRADHPAHRHGRRLPANLA